MVLRSTSCKCQATDTITVGVWLTFMYLSLICYYSGGTSFYKLRYMPGWVASTVNLHRSNDGLCGTDAMGSPLSLPSEWIAAFLLRKHHLKAELPASSFNHIEMPKANLQRHVKVTSVLAEGHKNHFSLSRFSVLALKWEDNKNLSKWYILRGTHC